MPVRMGPKSGKIQRIDPDEPRLRERPGPDEYNTNTTKKGTFQNKDPRAYSSQPPSKKNFSKMPQPRPRRRGDREA